MKGNGKLYNSYSEALAHIGSREKHLLIGNGFSQAFDTDIFSYKALAKQLRENADEDLIKLFEILKTDNFEEIMAKIDTSISITREFDNCATLLSRLEKNKKNLRLQLIKNIKNMHPEWVFSVNKEQTESCYNFIEPFLKNKNSIISTNYDLLLYWVLMKKMEDNKNHSCNDGFSYARVDNEDCYAPLELREIEDYLSWEANTNQNIFYLHGALHLFDKKTSIIKEQYLENDIIMDRIKKRMKKDEYPIFVMAGNEKEKLKHILHNQYLANCYHHLSSIGGSLITYGFSFGKSDEHIIKAINKSVQKNDNPLWSIYIGFYNKKDQDYIDSIKNKFACKVNTFDVKSVDLWGEN